MTGPHGDPAKNGQRFGEVVVTIALELGDCVIHAPRPGLIHTVIRRTRYHSVEEIQTAYSVQLGLAHTDPVARDIAAALKFAGQQLKAHQEERNR